jgi:hypothetical protein
MAAGVLYAGTNNEPVGDDPSELVGNSASEFQLTMAISTPVAKTPKSNSDATEKSPETLERQPVSRGRVALLTNMLMLEKARSQVAAVSGYSVNFHKHERIDGEMQDPQVVAMDVRHKPFSVYMKWRKGGDRGRQLLFVPERNDGLAMVRLGGLKGRLLPPLRIEPDGAKAMAESRYPITQAGILPLIDAVIAYRKEDIESRTGVDCLMFDDEEIDGKKVYSFKVTYPNCEVSEKYRVTYSYLDQATLIPVRLRNFSWACDAEELNQEELDEQTLIEDYAFSGLEITAQMQLAELFKKKKL